MYISGNFPQFGSGKKDKAVKMNFSASSWFLEVKLDMDAIYEME